MVESIMLFGIGFLAACLLMLTIAPVFHERAVRLTTQRLLGTIPMSMREALADKDRLRAEFAMSTRRLEVRVDDLNTKLASQLAETGKKAVEVHHLKVELDKKSALISVLRMRLRKSYVKRIVKLILFISDRARRISDRVRRPAGSPSFQIPA